MNNKFVAIITAGGSGKRLKSIKKKQFMEIMNRPLLFWTIDPFYKHNAISEIIITLPTDELDRYNNQIHNEFPDKKITIICGGKERQESVLCALKQCGKSTDYVLIHDGVRPFINKEDLTILINKVKITKAVIPVTPVKNTIKKIEKDIIQKTICRKQLYNALTPQVFDYNLILKHHERALNEDYNFTDDASILEYFGQEVSIHETSSENFKITDPFDLILAEIIIKQKWRDK